MDTLFYNGNIITLDSQNPSPEAVLVRDDKLLATGSLQALKYKAHNPKLIDLQKNTLLPAFTDAHTHFVETARGQLYIDVTGCHTADQLHAKLQEYRENQQSLLDRLGYKGIQSWIKGFGWEKIYFDTDPQINKNLIDSVFPDVPVSLASKDLHSNLCNSMALQIVGTPLAASVTNRPATDGIQFGTFADGTSNGYLYENSWSILERFIPKPDLALEQKLIKELVKKCHKYGLCGVHSMESRASAEIIQPICDELGFYFTWYYLGLNADKVDSFDYRGRFLPEKPHFINGGIKIFSDGSLGSDSAWLFEEENTPSAYGTDGLKARPYERGIKAELVGASQQGLQVAIHAIGDRAVYLIAEMIADTQKQTPCPHHRIEHLQAVRPCDVSLLKQIQVHGSMQPVHLRADREVLCRKWKVAQAYSFPVNTIYNAMHTAFGSDSPVETLNVLDGMRFAINRYGYLPQEAVSFSDALSGYTYKHHLIANREVSYGQIIAGQVANLAVVRGDAIKCLTGEGGFESLDECFEDSVVLTMVDGKEVWGET